MDGGRGGRKSQAAKWENEKRPDAIKVILGGRSPQGLTRKDPRMGP